MKRMRPLLYLLLMALSLLASSCKPAPQTNLWQSEVDQFKTATHTLFAPENLAQANPIRNKSDFDPNQRLEIYTHLSLVEGYTLAYLYHNTSNERATQDHNIRNHQSDSIQQQLKLIWKSGR